MVSAVFLCQGVIVSEASTFRLSSSSLALIAVIRFLIKNALYSSAPYLVYWDGSLSRRTSLFLRVRTVSLLGLVAVSSKISSGFSYSSISGSGQHSTIYSSSNFTKRSSIYRLNSAIQPMASSLFSTFCGFLLSSLCFTRVSSLTCTCQVGLAEFAYWLWA